MSQTIVAITPFPRYFNITWMLGSFCNYDCMYCPAEWHDSTSKPHNLDTMQHSWNNIYLAAETKKLPIKVNFTGGEVTANKNFLPLVEWIRSNFHLVKMVCITTNGSASLAYYEKLSDQVESITFSLHSEFVDEATFFTKAVALNNKMPRPKKSFHVNIMDECWNQHRIPKYINTLKNYNIEYSISEINMNKRVREFPILQGKYNIDQISKP